jgi:hypothetical protein
MITRDTVLILGAGASKPFGFPTGEELTNDIIAHLADAINISRDNAYKSGTLINVLLRSGISGNEMMIFRDSLKGSHFYSVDAFLEHRPEFREIGKMCIAYVISQYEYKSIGTLFNDNRDHWYRYLWSLFGTSFDSIHENKLSVLTFNYDRSLEYYLLNVLKNAFGKEHESCKNVLDNLQIEHLHGSLGNIFEDHGATNYGSVLNTPERLRTVSSSLKIIHDQISDQTFENAKQKIATASGVYFLGFGYGAVNINRLELKRTLKSVRHKYGTGVGMSPNQCHRIQEQMDGLLQIFSNSGCIQLLKDCGRF